MHIITAGKNLLILEKFRSLIWNPKKRLQSSIKNVFDWKINCFVCGKKAIRKYSTVSRVETLQSAYLSAILQWFGSKQRKHSNFYHIPAWIASSFRKIPVTKKWTTYRCYHDEKFWKSVPLWLEEEGDSELYGKMEELSEGIVMWMLFQ